MLYQGFRKHLKTRGQKEGIVAVFMCFISPRQAAAWECYWGEALASHPAGRGRGWFFTA